MKHLTPTVMLTAVLGLAGAAQGQITFEVIAEGSATDISPDGDWIAVFNGGAVSRWSVGGGLELIEANAGWNGKPTIADGGTRMAASIFDIDGIQTAGVWTEGQGWTALGAIDGGGVSGEDSSAYAISGDGTTVTGLAWRSDWKARAFSWTANTGMVNLGSTHDNRSSRGSVINNDGSVVGGFDEAPFGNRRPAVWIDGVLTVIEPDTEEWAEVVAVNATGDVVGGTGGAGETGPGAKIWAFNGAEWIGTIIGYLPGSDPLDREALVTGITADGTLAVGFNRSGFGPFADYNGFIWDEEGGMVNVEDWLIDNGIDIGDLDIRGLLDISDDGTVMAGMAYGDGFVQHAFRIVVGSVCAADFNGDGEVNTLDVLSFLNAWNAGDPSGDFNGDGSINTLDVLAFLNAWNAGC
jgi:probable HAF family extracellular repeat protein